MTVEATVAAMMAAAGVFVVAAVGDRKPYEPGRPWRPWKLLMALSLLAFMVLSGHLVTLLSGQLFVGRMGL